MGSAGSGGTFTAWKCIRMRGSPALLLSILAALLLVQAVSGNNVSIIQMPALYVSDFGAGTTHTINSYTFGVTQAVAGGSWMLLATNDQTIFARLDARLGEAFSAGETRQFNISNSGSYRWYYVYLQDGFPLGSNLEFHLHELSPAPTPTPSGTTGVTITIERVPLVVIFDFSGRATKVDHYYFTSSENLAGSQAWQLLGTNNPNILGSDNPALFTLLDDRSSVGFVAGVPKRFNVSSPAEFLYYVVYLQSGFSVAGMNLEMHLHETPPVPPVPPTVDFEGSPRAGYMPLQVSFTDRSTGTILNWSWDFGDGSTSSEQNPTHTYARAGAFNVNLTVCNAAGCFWHSYDNYVYILAPIPPAPTGTSGTPRYYIRIGEGRSGQTNVTEGGGKNQTVITPTPVTTETTPTGEIIPGETTPGQTSLFPWAGLPDLLVILGILAAIALPLSITLGILAAIILKVLLARQHP